MSFLPQLALAMKKVMVSAPPSVESLEARIAPAAVFTFTDIDGDEVTISTSKGSNAALAEIVTPYLVDSGSGQLLQKIDFTANPVFKGTDISITAIGSGDGSVNIGYINATGVDLGRVTISGDVGQIDAGDSNLSTPAIKALEIGSLGALGITTQNTAEASLVSTINGPLPRFVAHGDVQGTIAVVGGSKGRIGTIEIDGSLLGGAQQLSGSISASGKIGSVLILGDLQGGAAANTGFIGGAALKSVIIEGSILGGDGEFSGAIKVRGNIGKVLVNENITGGTADTAHHSGEIRANGVIKNVQIVGKLLGGGGDNSGAIGSGSGLGKIIIDGGIVGGGGFESGSVGTEGSIDEVTVGVGLTGGGGEKSGAILSTARVEVVTITGDISGGEGKNSGVIATEGGLVNVTVNGTVKGGSGEESGAIGSRKTLTSVSITGNLEGGDGVQSGAVVSSTSIGSVTVGGSVIGGSTSQSGAIGSFGTIGSVRIGADLKGMAGNTSGSILSGATISKVEIGGGIEGGSGFQSGAINSLGSIGSVKVEQDITGGGEFRAGGVYAEGKIQSVTIGGSLVGGTSSNTGMISTRGVIGSVVIDNDLEGGNSFYSGTIEGFRINNVLISGDIIGSTGTSSGVILATNPFSGGFDDSSQGSTERSSQVPEALLGNIKVLGDVIGGDGPLSGSIISEGRINSVSIGKLGTIGGEVLAAASSSPNSLPSGTGSLIGGTGSGSGNISAHGDIGSITIFRDVVGGFDNNQQEVSAQDNTGRIIAGGSIQKLTIGHNLVGGDSFYGNSSEGGSGDAGQVFAGGRIGTVEIGGSVLGGDGASSAMVYALDQIDKVNIGGSVLGGDGESSAMIRSGAIASITVEGSLVAGRGTYSASLIAEIQDIREIKIVGEVTTFTNIFTDNGFEPGGFNSASIAAARNLGNLDIGSISGQDAARVIISAGGQVGAHNDAQALAIASLIIRNGSSHADILAGYDNVRFSLYAVNPDAQIGKVVVGNPQGESFGWESTNIVAGSTTGYDNVFGTSDDEIIFNPSASSKVISKIANVVIHGSIFGGAEGIVAEQVGAVSAGGVKLPLVNGARNDVAVSIVPGLAVNEPKSTSIPVLAEPVI